MLDDIASKRQKELSESDRAIIQSMEKRLFEITETVIHTVSIEDDLEASEVSRFFQADGGQQSDWALEFVKSVCFVLSLNKKTQQEVTRIKRVRAQSLSSFTCHEQTPSSNSIWRLFRPFSLNLYF